MRLAVEKIELRAGAFRLGPLSLAAGDGEYLMVLGPTGAGKTVTLEAIAGLRAVSGGRISFDGRDVTAEPPEARRIGFLYQDSLLFPHLSVRDNLAYGAHRLRRGERAAAISRLAGLLEIEPLMDRMPRGLSGGERQRVALGRALAANPDLLLLDEPMAALDPNSRQMMREQIRRLHRELGTTTIHVTHSFSEALAMGDRVAVLMGGKIVQIGTPAAVFAQPDSAAIARFLRTANVVANAAGAEPEEAAIAIAPESVTLVSAPDRTQPPMLLAEAARIGDAREAAIDGEAIAGRVIAVEAGRGCVVIRLSVGIEMRAAIETGAELPAALAEGAAVWIRMPPARA